MYCRKCYYDLRNLGDQRCPECGTPFDTKDPNSFLGALPNETGKRIIRIIGLVVVALFAAFLIMFHQIMNQMGH